MMLQNQVLYCRFVVFGLRRFGLRVKIQSAGTVVKKILVNMKFYAHYEIQFKIKVEIKIIYESIILKL